MTYFSLNRKSLAVVLQRLLMLPKTGVRIAGVCQRRGLAVAVARLSANGQCLGIVFQRLLLLPKRLIDFA